MVFVMMYFRDVAHSTKVSPLSFINSSPNLPVAVYIGFVCFPICALKYPITIYATLGSVLFTLTLWYFHFLFMINHTPSWQLFSLEWHSRSRLCSVVKHSPRLLLAPSPIPITSHPNLVSLSSSSSYLM